MPLQKGQQVTAETLHHTLVVQEKLGEGGQGEVYRVTDDNTDYALKWYNLEQSTKEQKEAIRYLVKHGAPKGIAGQRFIWPLDIITINKATQFGYLMPLIDTQHFAELGEIQAHRKPSPSLAILCEISYQIANSYRALHLGGYCYRDISNGNVMFDPKKGEVLICDNDNVGINRHSKSQVWGTMEYMAPEVVRGDADPSIETDLHSLAILLFNLWVWHHPLHGEMEYQIYVWDVPAKRCIYGESPVFIFNPTDKRNQLPNDPEYDIAHQRWDYCPPSLQTFFTRAFTDGLNNPALRVTEGEWQTLFLQLKDSAIACSNCHAENLWDTKTLNCWHCQTEITIPPKLIFYYTSGQCPVLLTQKTKLFQRHIQPNTDMPNHIIGEVIQNPNNPNMWGIRNLTKTKWTATFPDGNTKSIESQRAAPLNLGLKLNIEGTKAEIMA
ncbi:protein kinase [Candidatus Parabeggiatoa sp. HSG14]|uniref:protein kinase domain-containing protein n=1 Tax=Candidatus Parabeggiatoa sp. HSG14 TaxID=3055593 RepID=UPI0025A7F6B5|nr:protein kinase [Thiotrichales bacterium HSG14]